MANIIRAFVVDVETEGKEKYYLGDRIFLDSRDDNYSATCQRIGKTGAIFCFDSYLDDAMSMYEPFHEEPIGGYSESDLRRFLQEVFYHDPIFDDIRDEMLPFKNGDYIRIPTKREMFYGKWPLMKLWNNRIAMTRRTYNTSLGILRNKYDSNHFLAVNILDFDSPYTIDAYELAGIRPVFKLSNKRRFEFRENAE